MNPTKLALVIAIPALVIGLVAGYFLGRYTLERQWAEPQVELSQSDVSRSSSDGADPTPPAGSRVLKPMPLQRARLALKQITDKDPVVVSVGSVGRDDTEIDLHLMIDNRGDCKVVAYRGIAYAFGPLGLPEPLNKHGEQYIAFSANAEKRPARPKGDGAKDGPGDDGDQEADDPILPKSNVKFERPVNFSNHANVLLAQIDAFTCADGKRWARN